MAGQVRYNFRQRIDHGQCRARQESRRGSLEAGLREFPGLFCEIPRSTCYRVNFALQEGEKKAKDAADEEERKKREEGMKDKKESDDDDDDEDDDDEKDDEPELTNETEVSESFGLPHENFFLSPELTNNLHFPGTGSR